MKPKDLPLFKNRAARKELEAACAAHGVTIDLFRRLLEVQREYIGSGRPKGIRSDFEECVAEFLESVEK